MKRIIIAPDSFKGACSAKKASSIISEAFSASFPLAEQDLIPLSDGGEGLIDFYHDALKIPIETLEVKNDTHKSRRVRFGMKENFAVIESAEVVSLPQTRKDISILYKTSYGIGELIKYVVERGVTNIVIGIGGTATVDLGLGLLQALGAVFYDEKMNQILPIPLNFAMIHSIDCEALQVYQGIDITVLCDIENTLYGKRGGIEKYSRQKGGTTEEVDSLSHNAKTIIPLLADSKHYGAGGGLAAGLGYFLKAKLVSGMEFNLSQIDFETRVQSVDLIISAEGSLDTQSFDGKTIGSLAKYSQRYKIPLLIFAGTVSLEDESILAFAINQNEEEFVNYKERTELNLQRCAARVFQVMKLK